MSAGDSFLSSCLLTGYDVDGKPYVSPHWICQCFLPCCQPTSTSQISTIRNHIVSVRTAQQSEVLGSAHVALTTS